MAKAWSSLIVACGLSASMAAAPNHAMAAVAHIGHSDPHVVHVSEDYAREQREALDHMLKESAHSITSADLVCASGREPEFAAKRDHPYEPAAYDICVRAAAVTGSNSEALNSFYSEVFKNSHLIEAEYQDLSFAIMQAVVFDGKSADGRYVLRINPHKGLVVDLPNAMIAEFGLIFGAIMRDTPLLPDPKDPNARQEQIRLNEILGRVGNGAELIVKKGFGQQSPVSADGGDIFVAAFKIGSNAALALRSGPR